MQSPILQLLKVILFWLFFGINLIFLSYFSISTLTDFMNPTYPWGTPNYMNCDELATYNPRDALWDYIVNACLFGLSALIATTASATPPAGLDCLVVLGAGLRPDGTPTETLRYRLDAALGYLEENPDTTCIVSGGQGFGESCTEADAMAEYLVGHGLSADRVTKEEASATTVENIRNSSELLDADATVAIVTNDFHLYRALRIAHKNGLPGAYGLAARTNPLYVPQATLRECAAIVKEALTGNL